MMEKVDLSGVYNGVLKVLFKVFVGKQYLEYKGTRDSSRYLFINFLLLMGSVFFAVFALIVRREGLMQRAMLDFALAGICFISVVLLRFRIPILVSGFIILIPFGIFCIYLTHLGTYGGLIAVWCFVFPVVSIFLLGLRYGTYISAGLGLVIGIVIFNPQLSNNMYAREGAVRFGAVFILLSLITIVSERIRITKEIEIDRLNSELQQGQEELLTMKDNISVGIFLLNHALIIQPYYSRVLEDIFSHSNLANKSILDIFSGSISAKQLGTLKDYFTMMFNKTHNMALLEEINPINEVEYVSVETRAKRILSCKFTCVDRANDTMLLGTVYDITEEKNLKERLQGEEDKRQAEMKALFEVIQVDPAVFSDFIEDTDYEFNRLNTTLKRKDLSLQNVILHFFQSIHAIKSNAAILGLDGFAQKCHDLEKEIKEIQAEPDIKFEHLLHLTLELDKLLIERDKFEQIVERINTFRKQSSKESIFVASIKTAIDKVAGETNKQVNLNVEKIDEDIIKSDLRNIIKEILLQFARNSVYHGIEHTDERISHKKPPAGQISLSMKKDPDRIEIVFSDDGKGLDIPSIKKRAVHANLIPPDANQNRIISAIFLPGFSTTDEETLSAGRGIGLSLVAERIKEINGRLVVTTKEGAGTTFTLQIPMKDKVV